VASIDDYATARELLAPIFDIIATEGVSPVVRETVNAVQPEEEITQAALAARLKLSKGTASYRVNKALAEGFLVNTEPNPRRPKKLTRGAPLPEQQPSLPTPEDLRRRFEGSKDSRVVSTSSAQVSRASSGTATAEERLICWRCRLPILKGEYCAECAAAGGDS